MSEKRETRVKGAQKYTHLYVLYMYLREEEEEESSERKKQKKRVSGPFYKSAPAGIER